MAAKQGVVEYVNQKVEERTLLLQPMCRCEEPGCKCRIRHLRGTVCVWCREGDHWRGLAHALDQVKERQEQQTMDHVADPDLV